MTNSPSLGEKFKHCDTLGMTALELGESELLAYDSKRLFFIENTPFAVNQILDEPNDKVLSSTQYLAKLLSLKKEESMASDKNFAQYLADRKDFGPKPSVPPLSEASGYVQPYQDSPLDEEAVGRNVFINMISRARRYIWIMTPYLIVDEAMDEVLTTAAKSGVDVRIITPGIPDKPYVYEMTRANYLALLEGGVRIFEYSPGFAHSKLFLADDESVAVGTVNLDFRSLYLHFEDGVWLYRADCVADVRRDFDETFPQCREITLADAAKVHLPRRLFRAALRLISPLM